MLDKLILFATVVSGSSEWCAVEKSSKELSYRNYSSIINNNFIEISVLGE